LFALARKPSITLVVVGNQGMIVALLVVAGTVADSLVDNLRENHRGQNLSVSHTIKDREGEKVPCPGGGGSEKHRCQRGSGILYRANNLRLML
jgi:hypothetical protein